MLRIASSFASARFLVTSVIQGSVSMSRRKAFSRAATIFSVRSFPSPPNVFATYSWPSASPSRTSVRLAQRFQRGLISRAPPRVLP